MNPTPTSSQVPQGLDPNAYILTKAIAMQEGGGKILSPDHPSGDFPNAAPGTAGGPYQFTPDTWKANAAEVLKDPNAPMTAENQNKVAYTKVKSWLDSGKTPAQVASMWNAGPGAPDAWKPGTVQKNGNTPLYAKNVQKYAEQLYSQSGAPQGGAQPAAQTDPNDPLGGKSFSDLYGAPVGGGAQGGSPADQESAQATGAMFPANVGGDTAVTAPLKVLGNMPVSAVNFAKGALDMINPLSIASKLMQIPGAFKDAVDANGGDVMKTLGEALGAAPGAAYQTIVPKSGQDLLKGDTEALQRDITNDPVGSIAPFLIAGRAAAGGIDAYTAKPGEAAMADYVKNLSPETANQPIPQPTGTNLGGAIDTAASKIAAPITAPVRAFGNFASGVIPNTTRYAFGQMFGINPKSITTLADNPNVDMSTLTRGSLGETINSAIEDNRTSLSEAGGAYNDVRSSASPVQVATPDLQTIIGDNTGLELGKGEKWTTGPDATLRGAADVAKVQRLYDFWKPTFDSGKMTPAQFLNLRSDLGDIAKFDNGIGKSQPLDLAAKGMYADLNSTYRDGIDGLAEKDATYSEQRAALDRLQKGLVDKNGNLTDGALNKIANAAGKGKDQLLARLEELSPGITKQIQLVKMAEDFEAAGGEKVGTYRRATGTVLGMAGGYFAGGPMGALAGVLAEMVINNPAVAEAIIRTYGKSKPLMSAVGGQIRKAAAAINQAPGAAIAAPASAATPSTVFGRPSPAVPALPAGQ